MFRTLKIIEAPSNVSFSKLVCEKLLDIVDDLKFIHHHEEKPADFPSLVGLLKNTDNDLFTWELEKLPDNMPSDVDFFFIAPLKVAILFKAGNKLLQTIRHFFCPPISFIGAGPGNPEWLTMEAKYVLDRCDIVFYDALVNPLIIAALNDHTEKFYVGKRGDSKSFDQAKLNSLIANHAKRGYKVGRLKGGDPGILGRITEEIDTLLKDNLSFQVIPGISAIQAVTSHAGIHLTQRGICDRVTLTTARSAGGETNNLLPFKESSLIVYMGILTAQKIEAQLLEAGYDKDLPAAVLQNLTRQGQRIYHTTLGNLAKTIEDNNIRPPGLLVFGQTARKDLQRISPPACLNHRKVLLLNDDPEALKVSLSVRRWGGSPTFLHKTLMTINDETVIPEYHDVILFTPRQVTDFYEILGGPKINPDATVISVGAEVDATFLCLFRKKTLIAKDGEDAIYLLKKYSLKLMLR